MQENFEQRPDRILRTVSIGTESAISELRAHSTSETGSAPDCWDQLILRGQRPKIVQAGNRRRVRILDLFSGAGGLAYGVSQALRDIGHTPIVELAADLDREALDIYDRNLAPHEVYNGDAAQLVDASIVHRKDRATFQKTPWIRDRRLASRLSGIDVLVGGPPCQGHSNLNNHTRRFDSRNELYLLMPAMAVALNIPTVIIENVREVQADYHRVVEQTRQLLTDSGYSISEGVLSALSLGLPQTRNRFFLIATKRSDTIIQVPISKILGLKRSRRDLRWAIGDLEDKQFDGIHRPAMLSDENRRRIDWLFDNGAYDLPDSERPDCHKNGHTYGAVYGRLQWDKAAGTVTTGFMTPGRGRHIHPSQRRALTPHEAARIQGFPDNFDFSLRDGEVPSNKTLGKVIGDAVPPIMGQAALFAAIELTSAPYEQLTRAAA